MIVNVLLGLSLFIFFSTCLRLALPNVKERERYIVNMAKGVLKNEAELKKAKQTKIQRYLADAVIPRLQKRWDVAFVRRLRQMHVFVDPDHSFEDMLAIKFSKSLVCALPILLLPFLIEEGYLFFMYPLLVFVVFFYEIWYIKTKFRSMQQQLIKDLPLFMDKMMIAMETGRPFLKVFEGLEDHSSGRMKTLLRQLNSDFLDMSAEDAIGRFAQETTIPFMLHFATAVKIGIHNGYNEAKEYLEDIRTEIQELRQISIEQMVNNKPKKIGMLYGMMIFFSLVGALIAILNILKEINQF